MTIRDALILLEATRIGMIPRVKRRLNGLERKYIRPNSVFAWNETECGMKRWTDGKNWSPSKVSGPFLIYRELDDNKNIKSDSLIKQSFSVITKQGQKLHLISYYLSGSQDKNSTPSNNPNFSSIQLTLQVYPDHLLETKEQEVYHSPEPVMVTTRYSPPTIHMPYLNQYTMQYNPNAQVPGPAPITATVPAPIAHYTSTPHPIASAYPPPPPPHQHPHPQHIASNSYSSVPKPQTPKVFQFNVPYGVGNSPVMSQPVPTAQFQPQSNGFEPHPPATMVADRYINNEYLPPIETIPRAFQPPPLPEHRTPCNYNRDDKYALNVLDKGFSTTV